MKDQCQFCGKEDVEVKPIDGTNGCQDCREQIAEDRPPTDAERRSFIEKAINKDV